MNSSIVFARWSQSAHHLTPASLGPPESIPHTASGMVQLFLHSSQQKVGPYALQWATPFPWKLPLGMGDPKLHLIHGSLVQVHNPNSISVSFSHFCRAQDH